MSSIAICIGGKVFNWDFFLMVLACLVTVCSTMGRAVSCNIRPFSAGTFALLAVPFSWLGSRTLYWYCHQEQFTGLLSAWGDISNPAGCLCGILAGVLTSAGLLRLLAIERRTARLLDCTAPGLALGMALLRLSALFNNTCRGKYLVTRSLFRALPFASPLHISSGQTEYRLATFALEAWAFLMMFILLDFSFAGDRRTHLRGRTFQTFLMLYSVTEILADSTRYDASFFHFNAFVSVSQMVSVWILLGLLVHLGRKEVRNHGFGWKPMLSWVLFLAALGAVGAAEYLVQRHIGWYYSCYTLMFCGCALGAADLCVLRRAGEKGTPPQARSSPRR